MKIGKLIALAALIYNANAASPSCLSVWVQSATYHPEAGTVGVINGNAAHLEVFNHTTWTQRDCLVQLITKNLQGVETMQASQWFTGVRMVGSASMQMDVALCGSGYSSVTLKIYVFQAGTMIQTDFDQITIKVP